MFKQLFISMTLGLAAGDYFARFLISNSDVTFINVIVFCLLLIALVLNSINY